MTQETQPLVLAVDDERYNLTLLERILRRSYRVKSVTNAQAALDMLAQAPFDLVLLDIMMPDVDGLSALQTIRNNPKTATIPVILISALSDGQNIADGLEAGANDYITKPIDMDVTLARVKTQIALKKLQDERDRTISELKAVQEMKDRLLSMASHDLKGPLGNVSMAAMLLGMTIGDVPDGQDLLRSIDSSVETMLNVIKDFLDTAAAQTGALDMQLEPVALEAMISDIVGEHKVNALRKNIEVKTHDLARTIHADRARFHQALGNLVSNAVKYTRPDSTVTIWTECKEQTVSIYVADQGAGIPQSDQSRLFTQFGKLTPRPTGGESSTGLGLWIVKHVIALQNGEVGYTAPPEGGSIFWIQMPAAAAS